MHNKADVAVAEGTCGHDVDGVESDRRPVMCSPESIPALDLGRECGIIIL